MLHAETDAAVRQQIVEPDWVDQILDFGELWLPTGAAFPTDGKQTRTPNVAKEVRVPDFEADASLTPVAKTWMSVPSMNVLIEGVRWLDIQAKFAALPLATPTVIPTQSLDRAEWLGHLPAPSPAPNPKRIIALSKEDYHPAGVVLDPPIIVPSSGESYTFDTGVTYHVRETTYFSGTLTFNPGCIIKFSPSRYLLTYGLITCNGTSTNRSLLTSYQDNLFGEEVGDLASQCDTCCPSYAAANALWDYYITSNLTITGMRFRWALTAMRFDSNYPSYTHTIVDYVFEECETGIFADNCRVAILTSVRSGVYYPRAGSGSYSYSGYVVDVGSMDQTGNGVIDRDE